jgi:hypothetical protein
MNHLGAEKAALSTVQVKLRVAEDRRSAEFAIAPAGEGLVAVDLSLEQLTALIDRLGAARQQMVEGTRVPAMEGQRVSTVVDTSWYVQSNQEGALMAFYHPSYGPVGFALPSQDVGEIVGLLQGALQHEHA